MLAVAYQADRQVSGVLTGVVPWMNWMGKEAALR